MTTQSASTSSNLQFWSVVAVQETERRSRLTELAGQQQFVRDAPLLLVWLADLSRVDRIAAEHQAQVDGTHYWTQQCFNRVLGCGRAARAGPHAGGAAQSWVRIEIDRHHSPIITRSAATKQVRASRALGPELATSLRCQSSNCHPREGEDPEHRNRCAG
jgi:hypothetical protein